MIESQSQDLRWKQVEPYIRKTLCIFVSDYGIIWAKRAWESLEKEGLTSYTSEEEKYRVWLRGAVLDWIYRDFCEVAHGETFERRDQWIHWTAPDGPLDPEALSAVVGENELPATVPKTNRARAAFNHLLEEEKSDVYQTLLKHFGGVVGLFVHLHLTSAGRIAHLYKLKGAPDGLRIVKQWSIERILREIERERGSGWLENQVFFHFDSTIPGGISTS